MAERVSNGKIFAADSGLFDTERIVNQVPDHGIYDHVVWDLDWVLLRWNVISPTMQVFNIQLRYHGDRDITIVNKFINLLPNHSDNGQLTRNTHLHVFQSSGVVRSGELRLYFGTGSDQPARGQVIVFVAGRVLRHYFARP